MLSPSGGGGTSWPQGKPEEERKMATRRKRTENGAPAGTGKRKNVDARMKLLLADPRMVEASFLAFLAACGRAADIDFKTLCLLFGELPWPGRRGPGASTCSGRA